MTRAETTHPGHDLPCDECPEYHCPGAVLMIEAKDVTDEIVEYVVNLVDGDYGDSPIDWESVFDNRLEGMVMEDLRVLSLGDQYDSPAMRKIQRNVRKIRSQG